MSFKRIALAFVLFDFTAFSLYAAVKEGPLGFVPNADSSLWYIQVFLDLCIAATFGARWLYRDAKSRGLNPIPWLVALPFIGSIAILGYVVFRPSEARQPERARPLTA